MTKPYDRDFAKLIHWLAERKLEAHTPKDGGLYVCAKRPRRKRLEFEKV